MSVAALFIESLVVFFLAGGFLGGIIPGAISALVVFVLGILARGYKTGAYFFGPICVFSMWAGVWTANYLARSHEVSSADLPTHLVIGGILGFILGLPAAGYVALGDKRET